jgi:hypothetical protein
MINYNIFAAIVGGFLVSGITACTVGVLNTFQPLIDEKYIFYSFFALWLLVSLFLYWIAK